MSNFNFLLYFWNFECPCSIHIEVLQLKHCITSSCVHNQPTLFIWSVMKNTTTAAPRSPYNLLLFLWLFFIYALFMNAIIFINPPFSCLLNFLHSRSKMKRDWMWLLIWSVIWDVEQSTALRWRGSQKYFYIWVLQIFKWMWPY